MSSKVKIYKCKYCDKDFGCKNNMYRHMKHNCDKKSVVNLINNSDGPMVQINMPSNVMVPSDAIKVLNETIKGITNINSIHPLNSYILCDLDIVQTLTIKHNYNSDEAIYFCINSVKTDDIKLFKLLYLNGPRDEWAISIINHKKRQYLIKIETGESKEDDGTIIYKSYRTNLKNAVLRLIKDQLSKTIDNGVGTQKFDTNVSYLFDELDVRVLMERLAIKDEVLFKKFIKELVTLT